MTEWECRQLLKLAASLHRAAKQEKRGAEAIASRRRRCIERGPVRCEWCAVDYTPLGNKRRHYWCSPTCEYKTKRPETLAWRAANPEREQQRLIERRADPARHRRQLAAMRAWRERKKGAPLRQYRSRCTAQTTAAG